MDLMTGLTAASQTLAIIEQIRSLDAAVDTALFKKKLLELQENAFEARAALLDAKEASLEKDEIISELKIKLKAATSGDACPLCRTGSLMTTKVVPHRKFGDMGIQEKFLSYENPQCSHTEKRMYDPTGLLDK